MAQNNLDLILRTKKEGNAEKETQSGLQGLKSGFESLTGVSLGATAAIGAVAAALKFSIDQAAEAEVIQAQLNAVLTSTGGVAGMTADEINNIATELSALSGVEDDAIVKAESVMLTFTKVGEEVFPSATEAALNMSAALGQDLQSSVIQVGKALNDPIAGVTALQRVGVSFTKEQKNMIQALVESGKTMEAQKFILAELETEFGGAAAAMGDTFTGSVNKLKNALGNLGEEVGGTLLLPTLTKVVNTLTLLLTWNKQVDAAYQAQKQSVFETSNSYEDYISSLEATAKATGGVINSEGDLIEVQRTGKGVRTSVIQENFALSKSEFSIKKYQEELIAQVPFMVEGYGKMAEAAAGAVDDTESLEDAQKRLKAAMSDLQLFIQGPLGDEYEDFKGKQDELKQKVAELTGTILELEGKQYLTKAQQEDLANLRGELGETNTALDENATAHDEATKRILFDLLTQRAAIDGLSEAEMKVLNDIALKWGLIDQATYDAVTSIDKSMQDLADGESIVEVVGQIDDLAEAANNAKGNYAIKFVITVTGDPIPDVSNTDPNDKGGGHKYGQYGVDFVVPGGYPNDSFTIHAQSAERVIVMTPGQQREAAARAQAQPAGDPELKAMLAVLPGQIGRAVRDAVLKVAG